MVWQRWLKRVRRRGVDVVIVGIAEAAVGGLATGMLFLLISSETVRGVGLIVFWVVVIAGGFWYFARRGGDEDEGDVAIYLNRNSLNQATGGLEKELSTVNEAWAVWYAGTHVQAHEVFERTKKPQVLVLLHPWGQHIRTTAPLFRRTVEEMSSYVLTTTRRAHAAGIRVYWFDGPITSMLFGNPQQDDAWVRVEVPFALSALRPNFVVRKADNRDFYETAFQAFQRMIESSESSYDCIADRLVPHWRSYEILARAIDAEIGTEDSGGYAWKSQQVDTDVHIRAVLGEEEADAFLKAGKTASLYDKTTERCKAQIKFLETLMSRCRQLAKDESSTTLLGLSIPDTSGSPLPPTS